MLTSIANYLTRSKISSDNNRRKKQFLSWDKIEKIALVIDEKNLNKSEIDKLIESTKKYVEVFYIDIRAKQASFADWNCLTSKSKTRLGLPSNACLNVLHKKEFDVVINVSSEYKLFSANLISGINAAFKCGNKNLFGELDLIVERKEGQGLSDYLKEVFRYLQMIRN